MSELFAYIATSSTSDPYVPPRPLNLDQLSRDTSDAFLALSGGRRVVGRIIFLPLQKSQPGHLLCDGREVSKIAYPELYEFLGNFMGTPTDPANFVLPNYIGGTAFVPAATAAPETTTGNTVTSETSSPGSGDSGGTVDPAVDSGGRVRITPGPLEP